MHLEANGLHVGKKKQKTKNKPLLWEEWWGRLTDPGWLKREGKCQAAKKQIVSLIPQLAPWFQGHSHTRHFASHKCSTDSHGHAPVSLSLFPFSSQSFCFRAEFHGRKEPVTEDWHHWNEGKDGRGVQLRDTPAWQGLEPSWSAPWLNTSLLSVFF